MSRSEIRVKRGGIKSMIYPCRDSLAELRFIVYKERCKLCLGLPRQTGGCRVWLCSHYSGTRRKSWEGNWQAVSMNEKFCWETKTILQCEGKGRERDVTRDRDTVRVTALSSLKDRKIERRRACSVLPFPCVCMCRTYMWFQGCSVRTQWKYTRDRVSMCVSTPLSRLAWPKPPLPPKLLQPFSQHLTPSTPPGLSTLRFLSRERLLFLTFSSSFSLRSCSAWASKSLFLRSCLAACAMVAMLWAALARPGPAVVVLLALVWRGDSDGTPTWCQPTVALLLLLLLRVPLQAFLLLLLLLFSRAVSYSPRLPAVGCYCGASLPPPSLSFSVSTCSLSQSLER